MNDTALAAADVAEQAPAVVCFPLGRRIGRIRSVAGLLLAAPDLETSDVCRHQIAQDLFVELAGIGMDESEQDEAVGAFFHAVEDEMLRQEWLRIETDVLEV